MSQSDLDDSAHEMLREPAPELRRVKKPGHTLFLRRSLGNAMKSFSFQTLTIVLSELCIRSPARTHDHTSPPQPDDSRHLTQKFSPSRTQVLYAPRSVLPYLDSILTSRQRSHLTCHSQCLTSRCLPVSHMNPTFPTRVSCILMGLLLYARPSRRHSTRCLCSRQSSSTDVKAFTVLFTSFTQSSHPLLSQILSPSRASRVQVSRSFSLTSAPQRIPQISTLHLRSLSFGNLPDPFLTLAAVYINLLIMCRGSCACCSICLLPCIDSATLFCVQSRVVSLPELAGILQSTPPLLMPRPLSSGRTSATSNIPFVNLFPGPRIMNFHLRHRLSAFPSYSSPESHLAEGTLA